MVSQVELDKLVDDMASIKKVAFKATVGTFFGLALLSVVARVAIRLRTLKRLSLDDYLLFFAATSLTAATGLLYTICDRLYLSAALQKDPVLAFSISSVVLFDLLDHAAQQFHTFIVLAWTATFFVKFSFLAFFRQLTWKTRVQRYYWVVVVITIVSYLFLVAEPFILCPNFGIESLSCFAPSKNLLYVSMTGLVTGLDAVTDFMIVSIPIIILHQAKIQTRQKVALGAFLCLSLVMVCLAITRASKIKGASGVDVPWEFFWQFMEASVAVLMGSLTVFRTLLTFRTHKSSEERKGPGLSPRSRALFSFHERMRRLRQKREQHSDEESQNGLPQIPSATLTGMRTFMRRENWDGGLETTTTVVGMSQNDTMAEDHDASSYRVTVTPNKQEGKQQSHEASWPLKEPGFVHVSTEIRQDEWRNQPEVSQHLSNFAGSTVQNDWECATFCRDSLQAYQESYPPYRPER